MDKKAYLIVHRCHRRRRKRRKQHRPNKRDWLRRLDV